MKKIIGLLMIVLLLVGCSMNDAKGLLNWHNKLISNGNDIIAIISSPAKNAEVKKIIEDSKVIIESGEKLQLDKGTKELYNELKTRHVKSLEYFEIMMKNNSAKTDKQVDNYNNATNSFNKNIDELGKLGDKIVKLQ